LNIIGGLWLKNRNNYDREMCNVNGWEYIKGRHYDAIINGKNFEVKKTKSSGVIIKLQQLAEILLDSELPEIYYLIIRTDQNQENIIETYIISAIVLCNIIRMSKKLANKVLFVHHTFNCTLQITVKLKDLREYKSYQYQSLKPKLSNSAV
jgi:hypothetical protein